MNRTGWGWTMRIGAVVLALALAAALPARAGAPPGRYQITTNGTPDDITDDTVLDVKTQLRWQRVFSQPLPWSASAAPGSAQAYCASLSVGTYTTGWRLPQIRELITITDTRQQRPAIDRVAFPGILMSPETGGSKRFWTATAVVPASGPVTQGWVVGPGTGRLGPLSSSGQNVNSLELARCVRAP